MKKREWCIFLLIVAIMLTVCSIALADDTRVSGLFTYSIKGNGTITITGYDWGNSNGDVYVPPTLDGFTVTGIGDEAFAADEKALEYASPVNVRIPETIVSIGERAFLNAPASNINIPNSVKFIGTGAFANCQLTQFIIEDTHDLYAVVEGALYDKKNKALIAWPKRSNQPVHIPQGILKIGDYAFYHCAFSRVKPSDILPSSVESIGQYAFAGTSFFTVVGGMEINVKTIEPYAFYQARTDSDFKVNATTVGDYAFYKLRGKHDNIYGYSSLRIGESIVEIGEYAFADMEDLYVILRSPQISTLYVKPHALKVFGKTQVVSC